MDRNWTPKSQLSITPAGVVIEIVLSGESAVWVGVEDRELCVHWQRQGDANASESRFHIPPGYNPQNAKASLAKGTLRIEVPPDNGLLVPKPVPMMIYCQGCGKHFDITVTRKGPENHRCPHCGELQAFDLDALVNKAIEQGKKMLRKRGGRRHL